MPPAVGCGATDASACALWGDGVAAPVSPTRCLQTRRPWRRRRRPSCLLRQRLPRRRPTWRILLHSPWCPPPFCLRVFSRPCRAHRRGESSGRTSRELNETSVGRTAATCETLRRGTGLSDADDPTADVSAGALCARAMPATCRRPAALSSPTPAPSPPDQRLPRSKMARLPGACGEEVRS